MLKAAILKAAQSAKSALTDLAVPGQLRVAQEASYAPGNPVSQDYVTYNVRVVVSGYAVTEIDGDRIQASDVKGILFAEPGMPAPNVGDQVLIGASTYRVLHNDRVMAGDEVVISQLHLRLA